MRISARVDYGVRVLVSLAADESQPTSCESIASAQDIPFRFLKAVMADLRRAGLVRSQRGCEGGYWIALPAAEITLTDVVVALEGRLLSVNGESDPHYPEPAQHLGGVWAAAERALDDVLGRTSIADVLQGTDRAVPAGLARR